MTPHRDQGTSHGVPLQQLPGGRRAIVLEAWFTKPGGRGGTGKKYQEHIEVYSHLVYADDTQEEFTIRLWPHDGDHRIITDRYDWKYWLANNKRAVFENWMIGIVQQDNNGVWKLTSVIPPDLNFREWLAEYDAHDDLLDWLAESEPVSDVPF